jgi:hypothetical protein
MPGIRLLQLMVLLLFSLTLPVPSPAQTTDNVLTNADVVKMVKAGLPESIILREIQMSRTDFGTNPSALIELKKQGASEGVLGAVLDSRMGRTRFESTPLPATHMAAQSGTSGPHHLPSFEADLRVNPARHEKISMGHNQIKVVQSGVPLFSLKWQEPKNSSK